MSESTDVSEMKYKQKKEWHTSFQVRAILSSIHRDVNGGAVPAHVSKGLLACFFDLAGSLNDSLHQFQVAAAQLSLGRHHPRQELAVLGLVDW